METHRPSSPPLARMLTAASAPVFLPTVWPLPISPTDGSGNACTKVLYAWHHTPESSLPLIHLNSYLGFLCLDVSQTGLLRSLLAAGIAGAIKLLIFLDWFRCPSQEAFPDFPC